MEIRRLTEKYLCDVIDIENESFSQPWSKTLMENELKNEAARYFVAISNNQTAGYGGYIKIDDFGEITNIAVKGNLRRIGIGKALLEHLIAQAKQDGLVRLNLEVRASNLPAIDMYAAAGFVIDGKRPGYYKKPKEDAVLMHLEVQN